MASPASESSSGDGISSLGGGRSSPGGELSSSGGGLPNQTKQDERTEAQVQNEPTKHQKEPKKESRLKKAWKWLALDLATFKTMVKAAIPPTIAIAFYQADDVAAEYTTIGYLVAIASMLGFCIMPRAKFVQTMTMNVLAVCIATALNLLAMYSVIKARQHTTPPGQAYSSSASAVAAVWLFFQTYLVNTVRSARPQLQFPGIIYTIFIIVALTYAPIFPDMTTAISFAKRLLAAFLTGLALATGVSFVIFPTTSRQIVFKEMTGYLNCIRSVINLQIKYMQSLEDLDIFKIATHGDGKVKASRTPEATALRGAIAKTRQIHAKLDADLLFGKRESAFGKLSAQDLDDITQRLGRVFLPLYGMSSIVDIFQRTAERRGFGPGKESGDAEKAEREWQGIMKALHEPFQAISQHMEEGVEHVLLVLEFKKRPKKKKEPDVESNAVKPGDVGFADYLDQKTKDFYDSRKITLRSWCEEQGIDVPENSLDAQFQWVHETGEDGLPTTPYNQRQLLLVLYLEYLLWSSSRAMYDLVSFADSKREQMKSTRFICPTLDMLKKWISSATGPEDVSQDDHYALEAFQASSEVYLGQSYKSSKDPEHLPPTNWFQKLGGHFIKLPKAVRSPHSVFGFRVACATMSVGIVAYLKTTYVFFTQQRLLWSLIMIAISMSRTAGQSLFNFLLRVFGTIVAMCAAYVIWYIVDGKTPGVIVFLFVWITIAFYVVVKFPQYVVVGVISSITVVLIIGYELQVQKLGIQVATSNGQAYYPIYLLAPYRLACVAGGLFVAFVWTIFPFPVAESSELRSSLGKSLAAVCRYYASVHETVKQRVNHGAKTDPLLDKARFEAFTKSMLLVSRMKTESQFSKWQIHLGGKFPKAIYDRIVIDVENVINYTALMGYASSTFELSNDAGQRQWVEDFRVMLSSVSSTSHEVTTILSLLSSSVSNGQPLPPYTKAPEPYGLLKKLAHLDKDILSVRHIDEPGYAAFAVLQIASRIIISDLAELIEKVKELVGELDFEFHVKTSSPRSSGDGEDALSKSGKDD